MKTLGKGGPPVTEVCSEKRGGVEVWGGGHLKKKKWIMVSQVSRSEKGDCKELGGEKQGVRRLISKYE